MPIELKSRDELPLLINARNYKIGVELGTRQGHFAEHLLKNTNLFMYCVDIWKQQPVEVYLDPANVSDVYQEACFREASAILASYPGRYKIIRKFTTDAAGDFEDDSVDFIYVDANHSHKTVLQDLRDWYPKLKVNGLMSGHDYLEDADGLGREFGVISALNDFLVDKPFELYVIPEIYASWYFFKESNVR